MIDSPALSDFPAWWVEARCACGRCTHIPVRMLLREWRRETEFSQIVKRLRRRTCGKRTATVDLVEDIQAGANGTGTAMGRRIALIP